MITVSGMEKKWAEQRYRMITIIKVRLLGTRRQSGTVPVPTGPVVHLVLLIAYAISIWYSIANG